MPDLQRARKSVLTFSRMAGWPLTLTQARSLTLTTYMTVIVAPRQSGKSRGLAVKAAQWAFRLPNQRVLIVSAGEDAARRLLAQVRAIVTGSPWLVASVIEEQAGLIRLSNGSEIRSVPASERQVRGWSVDLLLVDEAALVPDDLLLGAAIPTTAARPNARVVLASSAAVASGAFYDAAMRGMAGSEHTTTHRWTLADAEWISASMIESARESMSPLRFAAEYEGHFASGTDALFSREALDRVTRDIHLWPLSALPGPARLAAGVDWGATNDRSTFVAVARVPQAGPRTFAVACAHRWPAGARLTGEGSVAAEIARAPMHLAKLTAETNGLGLPLTEDLFRRFRERDDSDGGRVPQGGVVVTPLEMDAIFRRMQGGGLERPDPNLAPKPLPGVPHRPPFGTNLRPVHTTAEMKAAAYSSLRVMIDRESLLLPRDAVDLRRELLLLRVDLAPSGTERVEARTGHDDLADALAFALTPFRSSGRWRTWLQDLADPRTIVYEPSVPVAEVDPLPRHPVLQSVAGPELTVPPGVVLNPPALSAVEKAVKASQEARRKDPHGRRAHR